MRARHFQPTGLTPRGFLVVACAVAGIALAPGGAAAGATTTTTTAAAAATRPDDDLLDLLGPTTGPSQSLEESPELMLFKDMPVIVAAGRREETVAQAPASVSVVRDDDIELFGYRSLADVLRAQRGFYLHTDGLNWFAGVRGFLRPGEWNARIQVQVDGRPTNDLIFGQAHLDQDFVVPMEAVKQVEVIRGPGSALYGNGAVFGIVNVVTKSGADVDGLYLKATGGTQDNGRVSALFGAHTKDDWDVLAGAAGFTSQGNGDITYDGVHDAAHNFGHIRDSDYEGAEDAFIKISKGELTLEADIKNRQRDNRSATYLASFFDPGSMNEQRANVTLRVDHRISDTQSLHGTFFYSRYAYEQHYLYDADPAAGIPAYHYYTEAIDDWLGQEVHYDWQASPRFHLLLGADATESLFTRQKDHDTLNGTVLDVPASRTQWALFGEGELKVTDQLTLIGGLRMDHIQRTGTLFSPRFAAVLSPTKRDTVKAMYGRAFRAPNLYEQLYDSPGFNTPNRRLGPEVVDTYELAWERRFPDGWETSLNGFAWKMSDAMESVELADASIQTRNGPSIWAEGLEAEARRQWDTGARLRVYGTVTHAERDGDNLTHSPEWIVGASAAIPVFRKRTFLAIEPQIVGRMKSDLGQYTDPTFVTNVVFTSRDIVEGWTFQAGVYNLFANSARLPRDGAFNQFQPTLNWPSTLVLFSVSHKF